MYGESYKKSDLEIFGCKCFSYWRTLSDQNQGYGTIKFYVPQSFLPGRDNKTRNVVLSCSFFKQQNKKIQIKKFKIKFVTAIPTPTPLAAAQHNFDNSSGRRHDR